MPEAPATKVDVLIAGGGPVGSAIAIALAYSPLRVAVVGPAATANSDQRPIALSYGSRLILERLDAWPAGIATDISTIHVSHQGRFGRTRIEAAEHDLPALGYVAAYDALHTRVSARVGASRLEGVVTTIEENGDHARATTSAGLIDARLIVLSDGGQFTQTRSESYDQVAMIAQITADKPHMGRAWERFTPEGPLALLPFGNGYAMVWCTTPEAARKMTAENEALFLAALQRAFGHRAGRFTSATKRSQFPLALRRAKQAPARCITVGNAAQTLHPVAGQGLNLGLRDGAELAKLILDCAPGDLGSAAFADRYDAMRATDRGAGIRVTDTLVRLFSNSSPLAGLGRGSGLFLLDLLPAPRRFLARRMMFGMRALP